MATRVVRSGRHAAARTACSTNSSKPGFVSSQCESCIALMPTSIAEHSGITPGHKSPSMDAFTLIHATTRPCGYVVSPCFSAFS